MNNNSIIFSNEGDQAFKGNQQHENEGARWTNRTTGTVRNKTEKWKLISILRVCDNTASIKQEQPAMTNEHYIKP